MGESVAYPSFELQADREALLALLDGLTGYRIEAFGERIRGVWLRDRKGGTWFAEAEPRDLRFKFEVFALGVIGIGQLRARWCDWTRSDIPAEILEPFRSLMMARPPEPVAPAAFDDWPLDAGHVEVLRRAEFIVEDGDGGPAFGDNANGQSAASPEAVPMEASASCEVAVGLLVTGREDRHLLIAVDWMSMNLIVTQEAREIDEFVATCERIELGAYMEAEARA